MHNPLDSLFNPQSIAVIGASNDPVKWGHDVAARILMNPGNREIYMVNKSASEVLGMKSYASILDIPGKVEFAIIIIPFHLLMIITNALT